MTRPPDALRKDSRKMENMEKRALLALAVSFLILFVWTKYLAPPPAPQPVEAPVEGVVSAPPPSEGPVGEAEGADADPSAGSGQVEEVAAAGEEEVVLATDLFRAVLTNRGARVSSWQLLGFRTDAGDPVELVPPDSHNLDQLPLSVLVPGREDLTQLAAEGLYQVEHREAIGSGDGQVRLEYADTSGLRVEKTLTYRRGSYFLEIEVAVLEGGRRLPAWLVWGAGFGETAEGENMKASRFRESGGIVLDRGGQIERIRKGKIDEPRTMVTQVPILWGGMDTTYFTALMVPETPVRQATLYPSEYRLPPPPGTDDKEEVRPYQSIAMGPPGGVEGPGRYRLFVGPKDYELLREAGHDLKGVINFGWMPDSFWLSVLFGWFFFLVRWIAQGLYLALTWIYGYVGNYGVAIILLTVAIRSGFFPIMYHTQIKMRKMQQKTKKIQPKMKAIRERYRKAKADIKSRQKMNEEIMALYRKEGVNPMGGLAGCLPLLLQMPFLLGFYNVLRVTIELRQAPFFGWIQDLSLPDPFYVTPIMMGVSMMVQQRMTMNMAMDPAQRRMMNFMPIMFTIFFLNLPSGLVLYWFFSNLLGIGQQYLVNRQADHQVEEAKTKKPRRARAVSRT